MSNKYRYMICFIIAAVAIVLLLLLPDTVQVLNQHNCVVVIDAGHGGFDGGAVGRYTDVREDVLNLTVCQKLASLFEKNGYTVIMTREDENALGDTKDADMARRREIIENANADVVISVHMNKFRDGSVSGPMAFYYADSEDGKELARLIQEQLNEKLTPPKPREFKPERYFMLRAGECPCVLIECGFLSNEREEQLLQTDVYQNKCASAIYCGTAAYLEQRFATDITNDIDQ